MARKLNKAQKEYIEGLAGPDKWFLTEEEIQRVEALGWYETAHMDANRYLSDISQEKKYKVKGSF